MSTGSAALVGNLILSASDNAKHEGTSDSENPE